MNWEDVDFHTGSVHVRREKGRKARMTYVGAKTRWALLRWSDRPQAPAVSRDRGIGLKDEDNIEERKPRRFRRGWGSGHRSSAIFRLTPSGGAP